jgi:hypothetical protein
MQAIEILVVPVQTPLQRLADVRAKATAIGNQITEAERENGISLLREQQAACQAEYVMLLDEIAPTLVYSDDKFLKAIKKKGDSYREGNLKMVRSARTTRTVLMEKFAADFPQLLPKVCKIELTKADALIGKGSMEKYVEKKTTYSYELYDMTVMDWAERSTA